MAPDIVLTAAERAQLEQLVRAGHDTPRLAQRARMILLAADSMQNKDIAAQLGVGRVQVSRWRDRYAQLRLAGIETNLPRGAPPVRVDIARLKALIAQGRPPFSDPWSTRQLARELGVSAASISRHLRAAGLTPAATPGEEALSSGYDATPAPPLAENPPATVLSSATPVESVASTKVMPPRIAGNLIPREALMARLHDARRQRCMVVQGQAGSGKTSTLLAWRRSLLSLEYDVTWLSLAVEDNEPGRFFDCLLASIGEIDPAIVREAALLIGRDPDDAAIEHWVISLVHGLAAHRGEMVVMLDDLHHIDDPRIYQALQWLLDYAPEHVHLALSSRSALPLSLERLRAQGKLTEVDMRDLRFTADESEQFLSKRLGVIDKRDAAALHALTDGWVAGLQLFAVDLRTRQGSSYPLVHVRDARTFASYFEHEVLVRLAPDDLDMLTRMAVCNRICAALCAAVLQRPTDATQMETRLALLENDNLFITQIGSHDRETWYRVHPLLREVLLARVAAWPEAEQRGLHTAAWHWFGERGQIDDAVRHAVMAGEVAAAAGMVEHCAYELLSGGELGQLASLLRRLPTEQVQARFGLLVASAYLQLYTRKFDALRESLARMTSQQAMLDAGQCYAIALLRCGLALQQDDTDTVYALLDAVRDIPAGASDFAWTGRSNVLSWAYVYRGQYDRARAALDEAGDRPGAPRSRMLGHCISAMSLALEGHVVQAEKTVREVLREADEYGPAYAGVSCMATGLLADTLYELNDLEEALRLLAPRIDVLERVSLPDTVQRALMVLSEAQWLMGRRAEAGAWLARLTSYATRFGLDRVLVSALELRLRHHLEAGEMEQAVGVLQRLEALAAGYAGAQTGKALRIAYGVERARIAMRLYAHDYAGAVPRIERYIEVCEERGQQVRLATLWLQLAIAQHHIGAQQTAAQHFRQGLQIGHRLGLVRTLLDVSRETPRMLAMLLDAGTLDPILAFYAQRLLAAAAATGTPADADTRQGLLQDTMEALSEREREVVNLVAQAMPNKKIALVLNLSPETVKWHLKNIYAKLGVTGRGAAAARLRELAAGKPPARRG